MLLRNEPPGFLSNLGRLPDGVAPRKRLAGKANVVMFFTDKVRSLERDFAALAGAIKPDGMLWIAWPKKAAGRVTDLTEDVVRRVALERGLVDVKVCAIDDTWSGLKLVVRLKDRRSNKVAGRSAVSAKKQKER